jgi:hypothetical protein
MIATVRRISERRRRHTVWVAAAHTTDTNDDLLAALARCGVRARAVLPSLLSKLVRQTDTIVGRLDVRPTLDGIEEGSEQLRRAELASVMVAAERRRANVAAE